MCENRSSSSGFQMLELIVCTGIFLLVALLCAYLASTGFSLFSHTSSRHVLQRDARAMMAWLRRDAGLTNLNLIRVDNNRVSDSGFARNAVGIPSLQSWQDPLPTSALGLPDWNQMVIYLPTRDEPHGTLYRQVFNSVGGGHFPLTAPSAQSLFEDLIGGTTKIDAQRRLSSAIKELDFEVTVENDLLLVDLVVEEDAVSGSTGRARKEVLEINVAIKSRNTWPRNS